MRAKNRLTQPFLQYLRQWRGTGQIGQASSCVFANSTFPDETGRLWTRIRVWRPCMYSFEISQARSLLPKRCVAVDRIGRFNLCPLVWRPQNDLTLPRRADVAADYDGDRNERKKAASRSSAKRTETLTQSGSMAAAKHPFPPTGRKRSIPRRGTCRLPRGFGSDDSSAEPRSACWTCRSG